MLDAVKYRVPVLDEGVKKVLDKISDETNKYLNENGCNSQTLDKVFDRSMKIKDAIFWTYYGILPFEQNKVKVFNLDYRFEEANLIVDVRIETDDYEETITKIHKMNGGTK